MKSTLAIAACLIMLAVIPASSQTYSGQEADIYLRSAQGYIKDGDYDNALMSVYRAKESYAAADNTYGVKRCDDLISQIEALFPPIQLADKYYTIAGTYFMQTKDDVTVLQRSIDMANRARDIYTSIGGSAGTSGVLKCDDIVARARNRISEITNQCIKEGDDLRDKSQNSYVLGYYVEARNFALNASAKYVSCHYSAGIDNAAALLTSINNKIGDLKVQAKAGYDKALQYYALNTQDDNQRCIEFAVAAQKIYNQIQDQDGYATATALASRCRGGITAYEEERKREAQEYMDEAKRLYILPDCLNATDRVNKAKAIYQEFYYKAQEEEAKLPPERQKKTQLYQSYLDDVSHLMSKIMQTCQEGQMLKTAEEFYSRSQEYYLDNELSEALAYATNARNMFKNFNNYLGMSKCDTLLANINARINQKSEADGYMANARNFYGVANFDDATIEANKARTVYATVYDKDNLKKVDDFLADIDTGKKRFFEANDHFGKAQTLYDTSQYEKAIPEASAAKDLFIAVNFTMGINQSDTILKDSQEKIKAANTKFYTNVAIFGTLAVVIIVLVVQFTSRKRSIESEYSKRVKDEDERIRRHEEEFSIRTEEETKSRVDDELRRLIEEERGKTNES